VGLSLLTGDPATRACWASANVLGGTRGSLLGPVGIVDGTDEIMPPKLLVGKPGIGAGSIEYVPEPSCPGK